MAHVFHPFVVLHARCLFPRPWGPGGAFMAADILEYDFHFADESVALQWLYHEFVIPAGCCYIEFTVRRYP